VTGVAADHELGGLTADADRLLVGFTADAGRLLVGFTADAGRPLTGVMLVCCDVNHDSLDAD